jgi:hypothetical protein
VPSWLFAERSYRTGRIGAGVVKTYILLCMPCSRLYG